MWKISINSITQDTLDPNQYDFDVTYTNTDNGSIYSAQFRCARTSIEEFNKIIHENLVAFQSKDAFLNVQVGEYSIEQTDTEVPAFVAKAVVLQVEGVKIP